MSAARPRTVLLVGATGLVGGLALRRLLDEATWGSVVVLARRPTGTTHPKLTEHVTELGEVESRRELARCDDLLVALGTTIKAAGSQAAFERVDHDLVLTVARAARAQGATRCALVSSVGAAAGSFSFYLRTKGRAEDDVTALGWDSMTILRPSVLVGARKEQRTGEAIGVALGSALSGLLLGPTRKYRPIDADVVAAAAVAALRRGEPGPRVCLHPDLLALAQG